MARASRRSWPERAFNRPRLRLGYILRIRFGSWQIFECLCSCVSLLINTLPPVTGALFIRKAPWLQGFRARPVGENTFLGGRKHVRAVGETTFFGGRFHARGGRKHVESPFFSPPKDFGQETAHGQQRGFVLVGENTFPVPSGAITLER